MALAICPDERQDLSLGGKMKHAWCILLMMLNARLAFATEDCQNVKDFDQITKAVTEKFYDQTFKGLNWPERVSAHRKQVKCSDNGRQLASVVNSLLAELKTSHTALYTPDDIEYWGLKSIFSGDLEQFKVPFSGIWPMKLNGNVHARLVLQGSPAEKANVGTGDKLLSLNGNAFEPLGFPEGKKSVLLFDHDGKKNHRAFIRPYHLSIQTAFLLASKKTEKIFRSGHGEKIGYFHLWCGTHPEFLNALNQSLERFKAKGITRLILDLRDGFGGANPDYLKTLTTDSFYQKIPKVFLINDGVRSGKEWLAAIVKRDNLGRLIGTKTAGAFIGGGPVDLGTDKYLLYLAMKEFNPPDIPKLEGVGVAPDVVVEDCHQFCNGQDPALDWAINH